MRYDAEQAHSDAYGDALNEFTDNLEATVHELILSNCAGQWRSDVVKLIDADDDLPRSFLIAALEMLGGQRAAPAQSMAAE